MANKPNILLITADQLRHDALGCYGNTHCHTPHIDGLAARGVVFENGYTPNPICVPARASITTGNYPHVCTGVKRNGGKIGDDQPKLAEHFNRFGYETYACGKLHYMPYSPPGQARLLHGFTHCDLTESGRLVGQFDLQGQRRGLEDYIDYLADVGWAGYSRAHGSGNNDVRPCPTPLPAEHHVDHWVADRTIARMQEHRRGRADKPFLIWCSFPKPHQPLDPPYEYVQKYDPRKLPAPWGSVAALVHRNPSLEHHRYTHAIATLSPAALQVIKAYYYASIAHQDAQIGRVLAELSAQGLDDNTIIIYTADHGDMLGDFGTFFKTNFLEGSAHVPFLFAGPGCRRGQRRSQLVGLQDILPTLAVRSGCDLPTSVQGLDLSSALADGAAAVRDVYYGSSVDAPAQTAMLRDARWKYIYNQQGPIEELYDLVNDPHELQNLAEPNVPNREKLLAPWRERLIEQARATRDQSLLEGDHLAVAPAVDRSAFAKLPVSGIGWRWF